MNIRTLLSVLLSLSSLNGCSSIPPTAGSNALIDVIRNHEIIDLTHTLDKDFPFIPVPGVTFPFAPEPIAKLESHGVAANAWKIHEHMGTQIDAPNHFALGGKAWKPLPRGNRLCRLW